MPLRARTATTAAVLGLALATAVLTFGLADSNGDETKNSPPKPTPPTGPRVSFLCTVSNVGYIEPCG